MAKYYRLHDGPTNSESTSGKLSSIDYRAELNEQQYVAVTTPERVSLVIAGAGAGKTRVLTYRVAWLLDDGISPSQILLLTFTNKAAREMLDRVRNLVPVDLLSLWGGTFHAIGSRLLRRHAENLGFSRSFTILDGDDRKALIRHALANLKLDKIKRKQFPKAEVLSSIFSYADNTLRPLDETIELKYPYHYEHLSEISWVKDEYNRLKKESNAMDFDDLLMKSVELLDNNAFLRDLYRRKFRYILVDEYQDTNAIQERMIEALCGDGSHMMVVGDDSQSIYSWRGADVKHILEFSNRYPEAVTYKIETNYRSVPEILNFSNAAIAGNHNRIEKNLQSVRPSGNMKPAIVALNTSRLEARFVGQRIAELLEEGIEASEIAVLYRAHSHSMDVQMELTGRGIPFRVTSGIRFFEQAHIKDVLSFMRFASNGRDELAFRRIVGFLPGIGPVTSDKLWNQWQQYAEEAGNMGRLSMGTSYSVPTKARRNWDQLVVTMDELTPIDGIVPLPSAMIESIMEAMYDDFMKASYDDYEQRKMDVGQLVAFASQYESVEDFLELVSLLGNTDTEENNVPLTGKVTLSTIHQAKGLEWEVVFLIGLCDGMFPHALSVDSIDSENALEEERRLFYVGVTRAKDQLYLTYPRLAYSSYSSPLILPPSRFLEECPAELLEEWRVD